jgi:hypothetical protein
VVLLLLLGTITAALWSGSMKDHLGEEREVRADARASAYRTLLELEFLPEFSLCSFSLHCHIYTVHDIITIP